MQIITTHTNADFDALAAMVAAGKLYPEAQLVFPGTQEKNVRQFLEQVSLPLKRPRDLPLKEVQTLILVDNKNPDRLGPLARVLQNPGLEIHLYDHHPPGPGDLRGTVEVFEEVGATTTLLVERIRDQGLSLSPQEATLMALGIYEETGSFTYPSTTPRDLEAASYLVRCGVDFKCLSSFLVHELDADQIALLNTLIQEARTYYLDGIKVILSRGNTEAYVSELSTLTHKVRDMLNPDVLFVLVRMGDRLQLVARSRYPEINVGEIAAYFGGGGHATAAAAAIRDLTTIQVEEQILKILEDRIRPLKTARHIMTTPVKTISQEATIQEAGDEMTRYGVSVLPVVGDGDQFLGLITREIVQKAIFHGLGDAPVTDFMSTEVHRVDPSTPFREVETLMIEHNQRFMPVVEGDRVVGAITRTDLLRALHEDMHLVSAQETTPPAHPEGQNLRSRMQERLPARVFRLLQEAGRLAREMGYSAFVVGGFVRDLLLGIPNLDVDVVIEGDGIAVARRLAEAHRARLKTHERFGTAVVIFPDGFKLDVATARTEYYEYPTALPTVEHASIKKDLYRRDFTINALAVRLDPEDFGTLLDFFGGRRDLKEGIIRVLHNLSFVEDPTRIFRAIRFEQRYRFRLARHTENLIRSTLKMNLFQRISGQRIWDELVQILSEENPVAGVRRMAEFDLFQLIHPSLHIGERELRLLETIRETLTWFRLLFLRDRVHPWLVYWMGILDHLHREAVLEVLERLAIPQRVRGPVLKAKEEVPTLQRKLGRTLRPSEIYRLLQGQPLEALLFLMARAPQEGVKQKVSHYLTHLREVCHLLTGDDLVRLGIPKGPIYGQILQGVLEAQLDGEIHTSEEALQWVQRRYVPEEAQATTPETSRNQTASRRSRRSRRTRSRRSRSGEKEAPSQETESPESA